jgi:hypothetical protein
MPMGHAKMKLFAKQFCQIFKKKFPPETVERTLKSCKRFWNIFWEGV